MHASSEIQIRLARTDDAGSIARVLYESFAELEPLYTPGGFAATVLDAQQVLTRMREGPVWVAFRENQTLGTVAAVAKQESLYVRGMAVLPAARGLKLGERLLGEIEQWARVQGFNRLFLSTTPFLSAAIALYEKSGFQRMNEAPYDLHGTPLFTMEKDIRLLG